MKTSESISVVGNKGNISTSRNDDCRELDLLKASCDRQQGPGEDTANGGGEVSSGS